MNLPKVTLEQWIVFQSIIETGSFAKAADSLYKSQSSISYNINKMQDLIGLKIFEVKGRKSELTEIGKLIYQRSKDIVKQLSQLENAISHYRCGNEHKFTILIDELFPLDLLSISLKKFEELYPETHIMLLNSRKSLDINELCQTKADCAITRNKIRDDSTELLILDCYPYAHPDYKLHNNDEQLSLPSLHHHRQISHEALSTPKTSDDCHHCCQWQVDSLSMMMELIASKQGYGWLPKLHVDKSHLPLSKLSLQEDIQLQQTLYLTSTDPSLIGKAQRSFIDLLIKLCL